MNSNTALIMFAVIAAFGLATATLVVPQAHATTLIHPRLCHDLVDPGLERGTCARDALHPPLNP